MTVPKLNLKDYQAESELIWAVNNIRLPKGAAWDFTDRPWQIDIFEDKSKYLVIRKPTQVGLSTVMLTKMLYFADKYQIRAMYTLPRIDDISDMVYSRLEEIVRESPYIQDRMEGVDNVRMKHYGKSWIHFTEMSVPPRMMDVDWMCNDEVDLSNQEHLEQASSRMDASKYGVRHQISTPSIDGYGIDKLFNLSDMKHWFVTCGYCSYEQVLDWEINVVFHKDKVKYLCCQCHNEIFPDDIREGHWLAVGNTNSIYSGYHINQLMIPYISKEKLWYESKTMSSKTFYNYRLGLPYTASSGSITKDVLLDHCFHDQHSKEFANKDSQSMYVIGADQGDIITYSVGKITKDGRIRIVALGEVPFSDGFEEFGKIVRRYNAHKVVLDALPNHHSATQLAKNFGGKMRIAYFSGITEKYKEGDGNKLSINKTDSYDALLSAITEGKIQFYYNGEHIESIEEKALDHLCHMRRDVLYTQNRNTGRVTTHVWKNTGPDHFADAILYMLTAAELLTANSISLSIVDLSDLSAYGEVMRSDKELFESEYFDPQYSEKVIDRRGFAIDINKESNIRITKTDLAPDNPYKYQKMKTLDFYDEFFNPTGIIDG